MRKLVGCIPVFGRTASPPFMLSYPLLAVHFNSNTLRVCRYYPSRLPSKVGSCVGQLSTDSRTTNPCGDSDKKKEQGSIQIPEPPTNCCMSGCANCVWLAYAQELLQIYKSSDRVTQEVLQVVKDPSIKAFLSIELADALKKIND